MAAAVIVKNMHWKSSKNYCCANGSACICTADAELNVSCEVTSKI